MAKAEFLLSLCLEQTGYNFLLDCLKDLDKSPVCKMILHRNIAKHGSDHGHGTCHSASMHQAAEQAIPQPFDCAARKAGGANHGHGKVF